MIQGAPPPPEGIYCIEINAGATRLLFVVLVFFGAQKERWRRKGIGHLCESLGDRTGVAATKLTVTHAHAEITDRRVFRTLYLVRDLGFSP